MRIFKETVNNIQKALNSLNDDYLIEMADVLMYSVRQGKKVVIIGNGNNLADVHHITAELSNKNEYRKPLVRVLCNSNPAEMVQRAESSTITKLNSDLVRIWGDEKDCLLVVTSSMENAELMEAMEIGKERKMKTVALGPINSDVMMMADHPIEIDSEDEDVVQDAYMIVAHYLCDQVERSLSEPNRKKLAK